MNINVRKVNNEDDLKAVHQMRKIVFVDEQNCPPEEEFDQFDETATHFLVTNEDKPVGAGRFRIVEGYGKVERVCITKELRGTGCGKELMTAIEEYAKSIHLSKLCLNAQVSAIPFYEKLGYDICSDLFYEVEIPHKSMEKYL